MSGMKVAHVPVRKPMIKKDKPEIRTAASSSLKSAMVVPRHPPVREIFVTRSSSQRYAELPSLRYGPTTTPTAVQMIGSGPLRVYPSRQSTLQATKRFSSHELQPNLAPPCLLPSDSLTRRSCELLKETVPPIVRRVRFAELPPKFHSFESAHGGDEDWTSNISRRDVVPRASTHTSVHGVIHEPSASRSHLSKLGNQGTYIGGTVLKNPLAGREGRHRRPAPVSVILPPLLRAARAEDDAELLDLLRKAALLGIPADELNATDASGRTAVSYIASNGTLAALEAILELPGLDVNKPDNEGNTPLHFAAQAGQVEVLNHMLSRCTGLDIDARNALGFTALMKAALQGRTKCAKLLLFAGASPSMRDAGRGLRAEQWARFCGRYICAEVIEKFARHRMPDRSTANGGRWGSEPELAGRILTGKALPPAVSPALVHSNSIKNKLRRAFRTTSNPGTQDCPASFSIVTQLTSAALCASSPLLPSTHSTPIKPVMRPISVPRLQITLAGSNTASVLLDDDPREDETDIGLKDRPPTSRPAGRTKKKK